MLRLKPTEITLTTQDVEEAERRMAQKKAAGVVAASSDAGRPRALGSPFDPRVWPGPARSTNVVNVSPRMPAMVGQVSSVESSVEDIIRDRRRIGIARRPPSNAYLNASPASGGDGSTVRGSPAKKGSPIKVFDEEPLQPRRDDHESAPESPEEDADRSADLSRRLSRNLNLLDGAADSPPADDRQPRHQWKQENMARTTAASQSALGSAASAGSRVVGYAGLDSAWRSAWKGGCVRRALPHRNSGAIERSTQSQIFGSTLVDEETVSSSAEYSEYHSSKHHQDEAIGGTGGPSSVKSHLGLKSSSGFSRSPKVRWVGKLPHRFAGATSKSSPNLMTALLVTASSVTPPGGNRYEERISEGVGEGIERTYPLGSQEEQSVSPSAVSAILSKTPSPLTALERNAYARLSRLGKGSPHPAIPDGPKTTSQSPQRWPFVEPTEAALIQLTPGPHSPELSSRKNRGHLVWKSPERSLSNTGKSPVSRLQFVDNMTSPSSCRDAVDTTSPVLSGNASANPATRQGLSLGSIHHRNPWYPFDDPINTDAFYTASPSGGGRRERGGAPEQLGRIRTPGRAPSSNRSVPRRRMRAWQREQENPTEEEEARGFREEIAEELTAMEARERRGETMDETPPPVGRFERQLRGQ